MKPFIKWAGGKSQLISQFKKHFPKKFKTYYEPFLGGGAVYFHLKPESSALWDINHHLIDTYLCVRDELEDLLPLLAAHQQLHCKGHYYAVRAQNSGSDLERAARFIYLNKTCFNGLYRENSKGLFNVPIGSHKKPLIYDPDNLRQVSNQLQSAQIKLGSFESVLEYATNEDFVYFDPPYHPVSATSNFTAYTCNGFNDLDQSRLRHTFRILADRGVPIALSNSDCSFIWDLYAEFDIHEVVATRRINSVAEGRGQINELLITSNI